MDELRSGGFRVSQGALEALREVYASGARPRTRPPRRSPAWRETGEILCPHTAAVAVKVAEESRRPCR
jgi:threonine synthase